MRRNTNATRRERASIALEKYLDIGAGDPDDIEASITDLVTDLLHLGRREGLDAQTLLDRGRDHFEAEVAEEAPIFFDTDKPVARTDELARGGR